jgi:hypothetical protein
MKNSQIAMTPNHGGKLALLAMALVSLSAGPAQAYPGLPSPSLEVVVSQSGQSENLVTRARSLAQSRLAHTLLR